MAPAKKKARKIVQPLDFLDIHAYVRPTTLHKIHVCIVGSAFGDTIGMYTEFMTKSMAAKCYPEKSFRLADPMTTLHLDSHRSTCLLLTP